jgi:hypothetical protein
MIVYEKTLLDNEIAVEQASQLQEAGFISKEQLITIKRELPVFKTHKNILVRLGFLILGMFLYASICDVIALLGLVDISDHFFDICCYVFAAVGFLGVEVLAVQKYRQHGLDDAFILGALFNLGLAIAISTEAHELIIAIFVAVASFIMYKRYLHLLSMLIFCGSASAVLFYGLFECGTIGKTILPFVVMLAALGAYFGTKNLNKKISAHYYHKGILIANSFCLVLFYLSCNYLVVRELSVELLGDETAPGKDIPFAYFFYCARYLFGSGFKNKRQNFALDEFFSNCVFNLHDPILSFGFTNRNCAYTRWSYFVWNCLFFDKKIKRQRNWTNL